MKKSGLLALALCGALLTAGCGRQAPEPVTEAPAAQKAPTSVEIHYSNLAEPETQQALGQLMTLAGIGQNQQQVLFAHVNQINDVLDPELRTVGYEDGGSLFPKYDPYALQDAWNARYPDFMGYNCRITAFSLFQDFLTIPEDTRYDGGAILFDLQALQQDNSAFPGMENQFSALYANIPATASSDVEEQAQTVKEEWQRRGIEFSGDEDVRLISMVFHDLVDPQQPTLFVGHTGLLFPITPQEFFFLEKLSFQEPYQCIRFDSRRQLNDYLMGKYDLDFDQPNAAPFIMENDALMEDYRQLP